MKPVADKVMRPRSWGSHEGWVGGAGRKLEDNCVTSLTIHRSHAVFLCIFLAPTTQFLHNRLVGQVKSARPDQLRQDADSPEAPATERREKCVPSAACLITSSRASHHHLEENYTQLLTTICRHLECSFSGDLGTEVFPLSSSLE